MQGPRGYFRERLKKNLDLSEACQSSLGKRILMALPKSLALTTFLAVENIHGHDGIWFAEQSADGNARVTAMCRSARRDSTGRSC